MYDSTMVFKPHTYTSLPLIAIIVTDFFVRTTSGSNHYRFGMKNISTLAILMDGLVVNVGAFVLVCLVTL